jgi:hypothetical protein
MSSAAIRNLPQLFTPSLVVISQIGSQYDLLLNKVVPEFFLAYQAIFSKSKLIIINQTESSIGIEEVRGLQEQLSFGSWSGELQAVLLIRLDQASIPAQNALLKILEEPPAQTKFFVTTTAAESVLETVRSRCQIMILENDIEKYDFDTDGSISILDQISHNSMRESIELAESYQSKQECINILTNILNILHRKLQKLRSNNEDGENFIGLTTASKTVLTAIDQLQKNVNVKLVMVECFLKLKQLSL